MTPLEESALSPEEAVGYAESYYENHQRWPWRRYRVEGTAAGNSKLLIDMAAENACRKYGGTIVELIPTRARYLADRGLTGRYSRADAMAEDLPACPKCQAAAGHACTLPTGQKRVPHSNRTKLHAAMEGAADLPLCARCGQLAGRPCVTKGGHLRDPHQGRVTVDD